MLSLLPSFISCKGHAHLKPTLSPTGCHVPVSLPSANPVALFSIPNLPELQASGTLLGHFPLSCQYSVCWLLLFLCLPPKRKSRQDPLLLTLAPSRTTFTSRLPLQEAFPGTNPNPSPRHPAKPQGQDSPRAVHSSAAPEPALPVAAGTEALAAAESAAERKAATAGRGAVGCGPVGTGPAKGEALRLAPSAQLWTQTIGSYTHGPSLQREMLRSNAHSQAMPKLRPLLAPRPGTPAPCVSTPHLYPDAPPSRISSKVTV